VFFTRPVSGSVMVLSVLALAFPALRQLRRRRHARWRPADRDAQAKVA
jgi:hypothetical protein